MGAGGGGGYTYKSGPFIDDIVGSNEGATKLLQGLNPSKALGPDWLHHTCRVLKELASVQFLPISSNSLFTWLKSPKMVS